MRKLTLDDGSVWTYTIGRDTLVLKDPNNKRYNVTLVEVTGRSWEVLERGQWKKTTDGMVTPAHVRAYIDRILGGEHVSQQ